MTYNLFMITIKYFIKGHTYIIATSIDHLSTSKIKGLYKLRWRVEVQFKRLKSFNNLSKIHSTTESLWIQEVQARILYDTICRKVQLNPNIMVHRKKISYCYIAGVIHTSINNHINSASHPKINKKRFKYSLIIITKRKRKAIVLTLSRFLLTMWN